MKMNSYKVYCGPTLVAELARMLDEHTAETFQGTEHVLVKSFRTRDEMVTLLNTLMSGFTYRDVQELPE